MFRRPRPDELEEERPSFSKGERIGSAIAHAAPLIIGILLFPLLGNLGMAVLPSPVIAYIISRSFLHRELAWGAFQGMQAAIVHLFLVVLVFVAVLFGEMSSSELAIPQVVLFTFVAAFLLFLYTLWAAWDTAWGYDFRYILISNFVDRIIAANLRRQERRRQARGGPPNNY